MKITFSYEKQVQFLKFRFYSIYVEHTYGFFVDDVFDLPSHDNILQDKFSQSPLNESTQTNNINLQQENDENFVVQIEEFDNFKTYEYPRENHNESM